LIDREWPRSGELLGVGVRKRKAGKVDFARQIGIYALYDEQFRLVYVGQAGLGQRGLYSRLRAHTLNNLSERWSRFSWFGLIASEELETRDPEKERLEPINVTKSTILDQVEAVLIAASEPLRNKQSGRFGRDVTHYRQYKGEFNPDDNDSDDLED
jgi:hypothetical protein